MSTTPRTDAFYWIETGPAPVPRSAAEWGVFARELETELAHVRSELDKRRDMPALLLECRDALPAISLASARLHGVSLTLADRIETALTPWEVPNE